MTRDMGITSWEEVVARKRAIRKAAVEAYLPSLGVNELRASSEDGILNFHSPEVEAITGITELKELQEKIANGELSALQVITSYIERAAVVHQVSNVFTEVLFDSAISQAKYLDSHFAKTKTVIGPLHGIPLTVKDQFNVKGVDTTLGYVKNAFKPAEEDAVIVQIMKSLGAVVLGKTNLPQSIMWNETENPLFGLTSNPRNLNFTPGGSTGGEAVLLATHGTFISWGTDIGGSVRIPSAIMGTYALRPSSGRLPYLGVPVSTEGQEHVHSVVGPMTRTLSTLTTIAKAVVDAQPWRIDPRCHQLPWRQELYDEVQTRPLVVGLLVDDGVVKIHPPLKRALLQLNTRLKAAGHEVIPWNVEGHAEVVDVLDSYYTADGGQDVRDAVMAGGEPFIPHVEALINRGKAISVFDYWAINRRKLAVQRAYLQKWNNSKSPISGREADVILMANAPHCAVPHRKSRWVGYTKVWNVLDYTALTFPAGTINKNVDIAGPYEPRNEQDAWNWTVYDPETMHGHPIGLQIVGRRLEEEKVLGVAKVIEGLLARQIKS